jgi:hypothetical protein
MAVKLGLIVRGEHGLRILKRNRILRRIFGPIKDEVTGGWRKLHNGLLHNLYSPLLLKRSDKGY